jgi:hypothetical protein
VKAEILGNLERQQVSTGPADDEVIAFNEDNQAVRHRDLSLVRVALDIYASGTRVAGDKTDDGQNRESDEARPMHVLTIHSFSPWMTFRGDESNCCARVAARPAAT